MKKAAEEAISPRLFYVDRIESGIAILQEKDVENVTREVPHASLPKGTKAGCWLRAQPDTASVHTENTAETVRYRIDREETRAAKARVQALMDELSS